MIRTQLLVAASALALVTATHVALAQDGSARPLAEGVTVEVEGGAGPQAAGTPDLAALRYYIQRGDRQAIDAEIDRLRQLHPGWQPPTELFVKGSSVDEQPLWDLYDRGDYAAVRAGIGRLSAAHQGWAPPQKLLELMQENEVRSGIRGKLAARDWAGVAALAEAHPRQIACDRIDNMWGVAEARLGMGDRAAARALYERILDSCADPAHRLATVQKARAALGDGPTRELAQRAAAGAKSPEEAARLAALAQPPKPKRAVVGATKPQPPAEPAEIRALYRIGADADTARAAQAAADARRDAAATRKIGWLLYEAKDFAGAADAFARAEAWKSTAEGTKGLALARAELGDAAGLAELAERHADLVQPMLDGVRGKAVAAAFERNDFATVLAAGDTRDAGQRMLRGWTLMKLSRPTEAAMVFEAVLRDRTGTREQEEDAIYGLARSRMDLGMVREAAALADGYGMRLEQRQALRAEVLSHEIADALRQGRDRRALALLEERRVLAAPDRTALLQEAWARFHIGDTARAERIFVSLDRVLSTPETREGLRVIEAKTRPMSD
jgi:hypothetical protein